MTLVELAKKLRPLIEYAAQGLTDQDASKGAELFPRLKRDGSLIHVGTRINWHGKIMRAGVDMWDTENNDPDHAPSLWTGIEYREGYRIAPETFTAINAAEYGECMWFGDTLWKSTMSGNVFTPVQAPNVWELVEVSGA